MTVDKSIQIITAIRDKYLRDYNINPPTIKDSNGNAIRKPHPLDNITQDDMLFAIDNALKECAVRVTPRVLLRGNDSSDTVFKRITADYYVALPREPKVGEELHIDDGLAYGVTYMAVFFLWNGASEYKHIGGEIYRAYEAAYRDMQIDQLFNGGTEMATVAYFRYSSDGLAWHDDYVNGDIYISFKSGDQGMWSSAIRFVGRDGADATDGNLTELLDTPDAYTGMGGKVLAVKATEDGIEFIEQSGGGGGATTFVALTDTPNTLIADKFLKVNAAGNALELTDAPTGGATPIGAKKFGDYLQVGDGISGAYTLDGEVNNSFVLIPSGDATLSFKEFIDAESTTFYGQYGSSYKLFVIAGGHTVTIDTSNVQFYGDITIPTAGATIIDLFYDGMAFVVMSRNNYSTYA